MKISYLWGVFCGYDYFVSVNRNIVHIKVDRKTQQATVIVNKKVGYKFPDLCSAFNELTKDCQYILYTVENRDGCYRLYPKLETGAIMTDLDNMENLYEFNKFWFIGNIYDDAYFLGVNKKNHVYCYHEKIDKALQYRRDKYYNIIGGNFVIVPKNPKIREYDINGNMVYPYCMNASFVNNVLSVIPEKK